jgi:aminodeoxyfutalosine synthase
MMHEHRLKRHGLADIGDKLDRGLRLSLDDGERLFNCPDPTLVGALAHQARTRRHGDAATYVINQQLNYTNICVNRCLFCSYHRRKGEDGGFELTLRDVENKIRSWLHEPVTEIHIVGGCHPEWPLRHYEHMLRIVRELRPRAVLKCFTPVEIDHMARREGTNELEVLRRLQEAGLDMMPGGGAEIFDPAVRARICPQKISGSRWLEICARAHELGIRTNCTMLFGHLESASHRLRHLDALRRQQDETGGFLCFIPLPFQTEHNLLQGVRPLSGVQELTTIAVARLMLDNIPHVKSYWIMLGLKQAQAALYFGADDLDGTVVEEKIGHMAGAASPNLLARDELESMIGACGLRPVERDGLFRPAIPGHALAHRAGDRPDSATASRTG